jgi:hypothetical protein
VASADQEQRGLSVINGSSRLLIYRSYIYRAGITGALGFGY